MHGPTHWEGGSESGLFRRFLSKRQTAAATHAIKVSAKRCHSASLSSFTEPKCKAKTQEHKILAPQKELATIPSQHPTSGTRFQPQLQALPLAQHITPKPCSPNHLSQLSRPHRRGTFPPLCELLGGEGLKSLTEHPWLQLCSSHTKQKGGC